MNILIIDDEKDTRQRIARLLSVSDNVFQADNGLDALTLLDKEHIDLILTDICMPRMDGLELIRILRNQGRNAEIIVMSGYNDFNYAQKAIRYNVMDYLLKPIFKDDVFKILDKLVLFFNKKDNSPAQKISNISKQDVPIHLQKALEYISLNYGEKISLKEISDNSCVSKTYLSMSFSKYLGLTFIEYLNAYRIEIAKNMLLLSSASISDIAENVGIPDIVYFSKIFKKITGVSPGRFRTENSIKGTRIDD